MAELAQHWESDAAGVIPDQEVVDAYAAVAAAVQEGLPSSSSYAPHVARTSAGHRSRPGLPWTTRYSSAAVVPVPNGALARGGEGQDRSQAEDVGGRPDFEAGGLLGGHEPGRAASARWIPPPG